MLTSCEQGGTTKTADSMTQLMNAVKLVSRRIVKNFDNGLTEPSLERAYEAAPMKLALNEQVKLEDIAARLAVNPGDGGSGECQKA